MPYRISFFGPVGNPNLRGKTVERETAIEGWAPVQHLDGSAKIIDPFGNRISWLELRAIATKEAKPDDPVGASSSKKCHNSIQNVVSFGAYRARVTSMNSVEFEHVIDSLQPHKSSGDKHSDDCGLSPEEGVRLIQALASISNPAIRRAAINFILDLAKASG